MWKRWNEIPRLSNRKPWRQLHGEIAPYGMRGRWARFLERGLRGAAPIIPRRRTRYRRRRRCRQRYLRRPHPQFIGLRRSPPLAESVISPRLSWRIGPSMISWRARNFMNTVRKDVVTERSRMRYRRRRRPRWTLRKRRAHQWEVMICTPQKLSMGNACEHSRRG